MIKKIIGYRDANLVNYKMKFNVEVVFDWSLICDEVFPLSELTVLKVRGGWEAVEFVTNDINDVLEDLEVKSVNFNSGKLYQVKDKYSFIKAELDPVEMRKSSWDQREFTNPFYYLPNLSWEIVFIGSW